MCTAITYRTKSFYMGRTLDFDFAYPCEVTVMPRHFPLTLCHGGELREHFAIIGMAHTAEGYPLYFDAVNEKGLGIAGLNFVGNAAYAASGEDKPNIAQYELIPWLLGTCTTVKEACEALTSVHLTGTPFNENYPTASLHWLLADKNKAVVIEHTADGLHIYENPVGVMTNNPPSRSRWQTLRGTGGFPRISRRGILPRRWVCRNTAGGWERRVCPAGFPPTHGLYGWHLPAIMPSAAIAKKKASAGSSISSER